MTTDPRTGFTIRNSLTAEQWEQAQTQAREAATPEPPTTMGTVGQGAGLNQDTTGPLDLAKLADHQYWLAHKAEVFAAASRGEMPGQTENYTHSIN